MTLQEIHELINFAKANKVVKLKLSLGGDTIELEMSQTFVDPITDSIKNLGGEDAMKELFWSAGDGAQDFANIITPSPDNKPQGI